MFIYDIYPDLGRLTQTSVRQYVAALKDKFEENEPLASVLIQETPIWQGMRRCLVGMSEEDERKMFLEAEAARAKPNKISEYLMCLKSIPPEIVSGAPICDIMLRVCVNTEALVHYYTLNNWRELAYVFYYLCQV
jgi:hypothetical protein